MDENIVYIAEPKKEKVKTRIRVFLIITLVFVAVRLLIPLFPWFSEAMTILFLSMSIFHFVRYQRTVYTYSIEGDGLLIHKKNGRVNKLSLLIEKREIQKIRSKNVASYMEKKRPIIMDCCPTFKIDDYIVVEIFGDHRKYTFVKLECSDEFTKKLKDWAGK